MSTERAVVTERDAGEPRLRERARERERERDFCELISQVTDAACRCKQLLFNFVIIIVATVCFAVYQSVHPGRCPAVFSRLRGRHRNDWLTGRKTPLSEVTRTGYRCAP